jgi:hypothetical protein
MKVAVIKLGSRISFNANDTSGANGEARSICKMLKGGGAEVHIYTKILKKDNLVEDYKWHTLEGGPEWTPIFPEPMDALVVLNGNVNFFGGAEDPEQLKNYFIINSFGGPIFYVYCDPELTLKQVWPSVSKKEWGSKWHQNHLDITRTDITYLCQPFDTEMIRNDLKKNEIIPAKIVHFPFEQFPCLNEQLPFNPNPEVDLSYGGTMRGGKRIKKMAKFYWGHRENISVEMFGKIEAKDFDAKHVFGLRPPTFSGPVKYDEMLPKMNKAMAHCVIGDPYYEKINDMAQRAYESIWSNVVTFIDHDMDPMRRVYGSNKELADFLYVKDRDKLAHHIELLKTSTELRKHILEEQLKAIDFDATRYCTSFIDQIKALSESRK